MSSPMDMADRISAFLAEKNLKQVDFARIADIDKGTLSLMLNRTTAPEKAQAGNVMKAARAMGISMEELLTGERPSADAQIQLTNHVKALQIAMRSVVRALDSNIRVVGQAVGSELRAEAAGNPEEGIKPFDARSGLLLEVLSILGQAHLVGEVSAPVSKQSRSAV